MDDLNGLDWSSGPKEAGKPPPMSSSSLFSTMRASPTSGRSTPLSAASIPASNPKPPSKPATPANDSFANLVSFGTSGASNSNLSLLEKQKLLQEQKARQEAEKRNQFEAQYGGQNAQFWDSLDQAPKQPATARSATPTPAADDDFLAAFNASAPVDASTNFPVPSSTPEASSALNFDNDDDPFGLGQLPSKSTSGRPPPAENNDDDDDFLGLLGKPVSELPQPQKQKEPQVPTESPGLDDPRDGAIAELVDMGFPPEKAAQALESTESGVDVQAAVGWLLNQAHSESRQKTRAKSGLPPEESQSRSKRQNGAPSWMKGDESQGRRVDSRSPGSRDRDVGEMASNFGNQLFKTANTLWKTGSKKVQQAVHDFNSEVDPNRPRWMQEASLAGEDNGRVSQASRSSKPHGHEEPQRPGNVTDEALLLESDAGRPAPKASRRPKPVEPRLPQYPERFSEIRMEDRESRTPPPLREQQEQRQQAQQQRRPQQPPRDLKSQLNRGALEEQSAQAYVSPARRRRTPQPQKEEPAVDLFESPKPVAPAPSSSGPQSRPASKPKSPAPLPPRPKNVARSVPNVSPSALASFHKERETGNEAYKRGDYAAAHESFTRSLSHLPGNHPVTMLALSNRAMTALKIGEPKVAISDAESVLTYIGPSKGEGESIELGNGQPAKPMRDFFGKAIMRKAEGLEHLEKWAEAAQVWKQAVESGHGGGASIQGRNRCEKAAGISKPASTAASRSATPRAAPAVKRPTPRATPSNAVPTTAEAVTRLRAANEAAERADEEKLALTDSVDARLTAWKDGKQDNLRALLGSLDSVLWPEAGWKKVGLAELVLPNKVKIQYMKGIAKVHPDKISTNATTEQRMIAGAVFSTLNEAWDKFRKENNL
ncbi:Auxilin-like clathrin uncoating factor SWA2 [Talaromyces islandicus]|uniref:Auxilin-like clathrin uncoating factor SWA2 n=1 Tax=Talaromyces islandicus TaxID=28573 RepID=A0A0U1LW11_TALIS|nr:Auxilin-like clathrin uncoating factor SWA2 [Talaromyces islandicus]